MMKKLLLFISLLIPFVLFSQNYNPDANPIQTAASFLKNPYGARETGMGNSGVATTSDIYSMYWNPAKYAFITEDQQEKVVDYPKDLGFSLGYNRGYSYYFNNVRYTQLNAYKTINKQTLAASFNCMNWGDIVFTDQNGNPLYSFRPVEFSLDVSYSRRFSNSFSAALTSRYIQSKIIEPGIEIEGNETKIGRSYAVDISLLYRKKFNTPNLNYNMLSFGLNLSNIGSKMTFVSNSDYGEFIPTNLRLGASYFIEKGFHGIIVSTDVNKLLVPTPPVYEQDESGNLYIVQGMDPDVNAFRGMIQSFYDAPNGFKEEMQEFYYGFGLEYWFNRMAAFRTGYYRENENKGNRKNINLGLGFRYKFLGVDFTYSIIPNKEKDEENSIFSQQNNFYINLVFQIRTTRKVNIEE